VVSAGRSHEPIFLTLEATEPLTLKVITARLNKTRNDLAPEIGATAYRFDQQAVEIRMDAEINCYSSAIADDPRRVLKQPLIRDDGSETKQES
jgi:hypothetical protein